MIDEIGDAAGKVWTYLNANGEVTTAKLIRDVACTRDLAQRAIGWLAREGKVHLEKKERVETIRLA